MWKNTDYFVFSIERLVRDGKIESFFISLVFPFDWLSSTYIAYTWLKCVCFKIYLYFKFIRMHSFWLPDFREDTIDPLIMINKSRNNLSVGVKTSVEKRFQTQRLFCACIRKFVLIISLNIVLNMTITNRLKWKIIFLVSRRRIIR